MRKLTQSTGELTPLLTQIRRSNHRTSTMLRFAPLLTLILLAPGCSDADAEKLRRVGDKTYDRVTQLANSVSQELGQTLLEQKTSPTAPSILERVTQRLHWDRDLAVLDIQVTQKEESIILAGKVKTEALKQHAQDLAERTLGVQKVQNDIVLEDAKPEPKPDPAPASSPALGGPN